MGDNHSPVIVRRWVMFVLCIVLVWGFMFVVAPLIQRFPPVDAIATCIQETGINASAFFYTGVEETAEAEMYLHNAEIYGPGGQ